MEQLIKEFIAWNKENAAFYSELKEHDSCLYHRFKPVYEVLGHLESEITAGTLAASDDLDRIFAVGMEYLNEQFQTVRLYLENNFQGDLHALLHYDLIINALLYVEDLRYELIEQKINADEAALGKLVEELETLLETKNTIPKNIKIYVDDVVFRAIGDKKFTFNGIIDIFASIADTLGLDLDEEEEVLLGKDI